MISRNYCEQNFTFFPRATDIYHELTADNPATSHRSRGCAAAEFISQLYVSILGSQPSQTTWLEKVNTSYDSPSKAQKRAIRLLEEIIPPDLVRMYKAKGFIEVPSALDPTKHYRIHARNVGTLVYDEKGRKIASCCIHTADWRLPSTDRVIAEYLQLTDEKAYLKIANVTRFV